MNYKVGIVGDLHLDDRNTGKHINYYSNCCNICKQITEMVENNGITHLIFLGDLFGNTQHIVKKQSSRVHFTEYFAEWNKLTNGNVYSVAGNHDRGAYATDFDLLCASKLIKHPDKLQLEHNGIKMCFHFIDYGDEKRTIALETDGYNVCLMHAHLTIEGQTDYIKVQGGTELSTLDNLAGCGLVVSGHIHPPATKYMQTYIKGNAINLFYPGNTTRPRKEPDLWDTAYMLTIGTSDDGRIYETAIPFNLPNKEELFYTKEGTVAEEVEEDNVQINVEALGQILQNLQEYQLIVNGGYKEQLNRFGALDTEARDLALKYIEKAESVDSDVGNPNV